VREVDQASTGPHVFVPVDDRDRLVAAEDVVLADVRVADDVGLARERRSGRRVVDAADQVRGADELGVGKDLYRPIILLRRDVDLPVDEGERGAPAKPLASRWRSSACTNSELR
jgi:hypothetical protein